MTLRNAPVFFHAPHRVLFMAGALQGVLTMAWWLFDLGGRVGGAYALPDWPLPPSWVHAVLMIYGLFPFFMFGFLMTAGPRWVGAPAVAPGAYLATFALMAGGWVAFYVALWLPPLLLPALALILAGWCTGLAALARLMRARGGRRGHLLIVVVALAAGALGLAALGAFAAGGPGWLAQGAITGGLWFCLLPVFAAVCHRMIPFFSGAVIPGYRPLQPRGALRLLVGCGAGHGLLVLAGLPEWTWLADVPAAAVAVLLSAGWHLRRSLAVRLLAMLHVAFAWLGVAFALHAVHAALLFAGHGGLGLAPLHALTLGCFASLLIGMATRVTLGHSGRGLGPGEGAWGIFLAMQAAALLRVAAEFVRMPAMAVLWALAALAWLAAFGVWVAAYAPAYLRPRADGEAG